MTEFHRDDPQPGEGDPAAAACAPSANNEDVVPAEAVAPEAAPPAEVRADSDQAVALEPAAEAPAPAETPDPEAALAAARQEVDRLQDRLLRLQAEFENSRKRADRQRADFHRLAIEGVALDLLPVMDNLERALAAARIAEGTSALIEGVELTLKLFRAALERVGVVALESLGHPFDPARHEAVAQVDVADGEDQTVVDEVQPGYLIQGRVLRPAMVKVSRVVRPDGRAPGDGAGEAAGRDPEPTA